MPDAPNPDFDRIAKGGISPALPDCPKLPDSLRQKLPDLRAAFDQYDRDWQDYFKKLIASGRLR